MYQPYWDFYVPSNKYKLVNYFIERYPNTSQSKWLKMTSKRLKQIYIAIRTREG